MDGFDCTGLLMVIHTMKNVSVQKAAAIEKIGACYFCLKADEQCGLFRNFSLPALGICEKFGADIEKIQGFQTARA